MPQPPSSSGGWGGARPGAGRKPKLQVLHSTSSGPPLPRFSGNGVLNIGSRRPPAGPTLGSALENLRQAAPPPGSVSPEPPAGSASSPSGVQAAPPAGVTPRPENESFANLVGYVATNVGVLVIGDSIRKGGKEPNEPDEADIERTAESTAKAIVIGLGDTTVPWWAAVIASWGSLYLSMRVGARPLQAASNDNQVTNDNAASSSPPAPATTVLGQGVPQQRQRGTTEYQRLPDVPTFGTGTQ